MICDIYDNVLEDHVAQLIDMEMKEITWRYDYNSHIFLSHFSVRSK